jgi:diaminopimelate decarboxylase
MPSIDELLTRARDVLAAETPLLDRRVLQGVVEAVLSRRDSYQALRRKHGSPLYVFEPDTLLDRARRFGEAFDRSLPGTRCYYAVKSNSYPGICEHLVRAGWGLDVSSGLELELALACGAQDIVFSGPGKQDAELLAAINHTRRVTLLIDSFGELRRLSRLAAAQGRRVSAGVRLAVDHTGMWRKFGIPPSELPRFLGEAHDGGSVRVCGLQFHTSWNMNADAQGAFLGELGPVLAELPRRHRDDIEFLDLGGGFWPPAGEWLHHVGTPAGRLRDAITQGDPGPSQHHCVPSEGIERFAARLAAAVATHVLPWVSCQIRVEPGRWVSNDAMHLLLTVVDKKAGDLVITDGGTNAVGWERYEVDYFPVVNLSRPGTDEHSCYILGSLCTPRDIWGYTYHGSGIEPGDALLIPNQGAYTYSLRQDFIKPLPEVVVLR